MAVAARDSMSEQRARIWPGGFQACGGGRNAMMIFPSTTFAGKEATPKSEVPTKHPVVTSNFIPCTGQVTILPL